MENRLWLADLLHDTGSLPEGKFEQIQAVCQTARNAV